ncbi:5'-methylthioadenosine/adenosylhomocysteine nucleosidase [Isobaculum melis]|uniref:5'-methylthioadenosine/S-adenosylhomocysteine nucleosidase n=1 Tax=Isobaculum melis TaxID=142588 RepID=A0A1H9RH64_9LACT|nr:5'-methylthioadenosine/adenosylhomocysteine nucleosidase [Isobaculum melis]SER72151.1 adenosylhomocysteine nucleosidase [Isobaculum melis]
MAKIGIIGAMEEELRILREKMTITKEYTIAGAAFTEGLLENHEVVVVLCGIGKVNAALTTTLLLNQGDFSAVINTGSAGALKSGMEIGDIVISNEVAYHDVDVTAFGYLMGQVPQMPARYLADKALVEQAQLAAAETALPSHVGLIVSSDSFIASKEASERILAHFPDVYASEMEGAAIAQVAHRFKTPFVVVRAMSDTASEEATVDFDTFIIEAGKRSANFVCQLLTHLA